MFLFLLEQMDHSLKKVGVSVMDEQLRIKLNRTDIIW